MKRSSLIAALLASVATACAGGGSGTGTSSDAAISGTVTGVGSLAIDGVGYDGSSAVVEVDRDDPAALAAGTLADVRLGCQVEARGDGHGRLRSLVVRAALRGPVDAVDAPGHTFGALGQTVRVTSGTSADTVFEGVTGLADLKAGDLVEVHGTFDATGAILATRVELEPASTSLRLRVSGFAKDVDAAGTGFTLGALKVDASAARIAPRGAKLTEGALVYVFATALPQSGTLTARAVRVVTLPAEGQRVVLGGRVSAFTALSSFVLAGVPVDASGATITGGQASDIQVGTLLRVEGTVHVVSPGPPPSFSVVATRVHIVPAHDQRPVMLVGPITGFVSPAQFKVWNVAVDASAATVENGALADLKDGLVVVVKGHVDGTTVKADTVRILVPAMPH
jgi:hypothetical protein